MNPNADNGLRGIMMFQYRFISFNIRTTLVGTAGVAMLSVGVGDLREISKPSAQFFSEPKTALKNSLFKKQTNTDCFKRVTISDVNDVSLCKIVLGRF